MRIANIVVSIILVALSFSAGRFGIMTANASHEGWFGAYRAIMGIAALPSSVFLFGMSIVTLTVTRQEFLEILADHRSPSGRTIMVAGKQDQITKSGSRYESLFD
jgi:hypothetical protein